jgi:hypothetical protein
MDCDDVNWACDGGWMLDAYDFTKTRGIIAWNDYERTYNAKKNVCKEPAMRTPKFFNVGGVEEDNISN